MKIGECESCGKIKVLNKNNYCGDCENEI